ncbi:tRNA (adenosine(37)-N6)-threonylcarbamoyltransferase complex dimerization subunit type 1 TsaB, partial [Microbacteriaceae bacterium K1510]|nr:tRNA (adenosine(37)-N6)-threonylcarbamoyltransferase complex dimerization subunit type 1 TsaB [Frankia sp. Cpl3]MCK9910670.1 tRNA (adenosine(37)-N6)-threonylcarbamoyltransferase complex dimerization subunit type 1 TsaB [Microbacteriaceae bacterium K1510]
DFISLLLDELSLMPEQLDGIAVAKGPGSYTGVRIGVATAKNMAWSLGIPVVGVSSLQAVAANAAGFAGGIVPLFDARRGQVYTGYYRSEGLQALHETVAERIVLLREWLPIVADCSGGQRVLFLGDDLPIHRKTIMEMLGEQAQFAPVSFNHPRAAHVAWLAAEQFAKAGSAHDLMPEYLQMAEAEAKWLAQSRSEKQG